MNTTMDSVRLTPNDKPRRRTRRGVPTSPPPLPYSPDRHATEIDSPLPLPLSNRSSFSLPSHWVAPMSVGLSWTVITVPSFVVVPSRRSLSRLPPPQSELASVLERPPLSSSLPSSFRSAPPPPATAPPFSQSGSYVLYRIELQSSVPSSRPGVNRNASDAVLDRHDSAVYRRYKDFEALHKALKRCGVHYYNADGKTRAPRLPSKQLLHKLNGRFKDGDFVRQRLEGLRDYLAVVLEQHEARLCGEEDSRGGAGDAILRADALLRRFLVG